MSRTVRARTWEELVVLICMGAGFGQQIEGTLYWKMDASCGSSGIGRDSRDSQGRLRLPENQGQTANCADDLESEIV